MSNINLELEGIEGQKENGTKWYDNIGQRASLEVKGQWRIVENIYYFQLFLQAKMADSN